jgi:hypothetical protein
VWRLKYLIIGMLPAAILCVGLYFLAPALADELRDAVRESAQDAVAEVFEDEVPATVSPGQIVITESDLTIAIEDTDRRESTWNIDGVEVLIENGEVRIVGRDSGSRDDEMDIAAAVPVIQDGRFELTERSGVLTIFKSARDAIADQIETEVEALFERSGVVPVSVTAENGRLVIVTEAAEGGPAPTVDSADDSEPTAPAGDDDGTPRGGIFDALRQPTSTPDR